jgi:hypothetical protein
VVQGGGGRRGDSGSPWARSLEDAAQDGVAVSGGTPR